MARALAQASEMNDGGKATERWREGKADLHTQCRLLVYEASPQLCGLNASVCPFRTNKSVLDSHSRTLVSMLESLTLGQRASAESECHSESHARKISAGTQPLRSGGVNSGCVATKEMPQTLPLPRGTPGSCCPAHQAPRAPVPCTLECGSTTVFLPPEWCWCPATTFS